MVVVVILVVIAVKYSGTPFITKLEATEEK
jgi:hypothetical protein